MGLKQSNIKIVKKPTPVDLQFRKAVGKNEIYFKRIEESNFFKHYNIEEILYMLLRFYPEDSDDELNEKFREYNKNFNTQCFQQKVNVITDSKFQKFLESKIMNNPLISSEFLYSGNSYSNEANYFKQFYMHFFTFLYKTFKNFAKHTFDTKIHSDDMVSKYALVPLAFQYGNAQMRVKIDVFFNLFASNKDTISLNDFNLRTTLFFLIACSTGVSILTLNEVATEIEEERKVFSEDEFVRIYDLYQIKDIERIYYDVLAKLFDTTEVKEAPNKEINSEVFKWNFTKNGFYWLFYPAGPRDFLESHPE